MATIACLQSESDLVSVALALVEEHEKPSPPVDGLFRKARRPVDVAFVEGLRVSIIAGGDPLGEAFARIRPASERRAKGATYTPAPIVKSMLAWASQNDHPVRVVDPGAGSGRFLLAAARRFPKAELVGVEFDPVAALMLCANASVRGLGKRTSVFVGDYRSIRLPKIEGQTLFIGNPPYVRHHGISRRWKSWYAKAADVYGVKASKLAGLHVHFFLRTLQLAKDGDYGSFITSAEWLDVNYGSALKQLLANGLGGVELHVLNPKTMPFDDATTTGAITCFRIGSRTTVMRVRSVRNAKRLGSLSTGRTVSWRRLANTRRWSTVVHRTRPVPKPPRGYVELGKICRVHRGQVTGCNAVWIAGERARGLPPKVLFPTITKARDILDVGERLTTSAGLRRTIDLPADLSKMGRAHKDAVQRFLRWAKNKGADRSYIARHRKAWWAVGLREPAPIICTYMGRRPPVFVRNLCGARHINIAHGLYPREPLADEVLDALVRWLRAHVRVEDGRTYAGGLTKFEPKELERLLIPSLEDLPR